MAAIVDRLKKQLKAQGKTTAGIQTISEAIRALGGEREGEDVAKVVDASIITITTPGAVAEDDEGGEGEA